MSDGTSERTSAGTNGLQWQDSGRRHGLARIVVALLRIFAYAYLLRFPLLTGIAILAITIAALTLAQPLLGNLFDIHWRWGVAWLSFTTFTAAWVVMVTSRLILLYGDARFRLSPIIAPYSIDPRLSRLPYLFFGGIVALPVIAASIYYTAVNNDSVWLAASGSVSIGWMLLEALLGGAASLLLLYLLALGQKAFSVPAHPGPKSIVGGIDYAAAMPDTFFPSRSFMLDKVRKKKPSATVSDKTSANNGSERAADEADQTYFLERTADRIAKLFRDVPESIGGGYFEYVDAKAVSVLPGHGAAAFLFIGLLVVYGVLGYVQFHSLIEPTGSAAAFPTLAYAMLLLMLLCWTFTGLAFFLDRFRVPVLIPMLLWLTLTSWLPWSDFYYEVLQAPEVASKEIAAKPASTAPSAAPSTEPAKPDTMVVVAANGGGIQAAAWTVRVLAGLQESVGAQFGNSLRLVSAVSGGSIGAVYFLNEYEQGHAPPSRELQNIVARVQSSSLDQIAWATTYPDFLRLFTSFGFGWDRGRMLEHSWLRKRSKWPNRPGVESGLAQWRSDYERGWRPGLILNATVAETGERLAIATVPLPGKDMGAILGGKDIRVITAARLSASFPYVSPAARADADSPQPHIVDGGYYDNYGIASLVEWLDRELSKDDQPIKRVLVVRIHGAPSGSAASVVTEGASFEPSSDITNRGWFYQTFAPVKTLLAVRGAGQRSHADVQLRLLTEKYERAPEKGHAVKIQTVTFEFCGDGKDKYCSKPAPLSWHLNEYEKCAIEQSWQAQWKNAEQSSLGAVRDFFGMPKKVATAPAQLASTSAACLEAGARE